MKNEFHPKPDTAGVQINESMQTNIEFISEE